MVNKIFIGIAAVCIAICCAVSFFYLGNIISNIKFFEAFTWQSIQKVFLIIGGIGASFSLFLAVIGFEKSLLQEELDMFEDVLQELRAKVSLNKSKKNNFKIAADVLEYIENDSEKFIDFIEDTSLVHYQNEFKAFLIRTEKVICTLPEDAKAYFLPLLLKITYFDKEDLNKDNLKIYALELNTEYDKARKIMKYDENEWEEEVKKTQERVKATQKMMEEKQKSFFKKGDK
ncbi:hypothetical protein [Listeria monocytogenes]|uniref:hypothetical protein n=1 Tax=Listeria monocytogenes TaxID=1639 RepID=UPI000E73F7ED|nr:hypothetical protein [Listeria monocytogenes]RJZ18313.1 hypothetical protein DYZ51_03001 [Listeria monocytogenes]